jgi:hypothetical protein
MPEHLEYRDDDLFNPETHHEESDVPTSPLFKFIVFFVIFAAVSHVVLWFFYKALVKGERNIAGEPMTALQRPANADVPQNQPLLQPFPKVDPKGAPIAPHTDTPVADLVHMRANEEQQLHSYGWVDKQKGIVRIPIEAAKEKLVHTLAVAGQTGQPTQGTLPAPGVPASPADTGVPAPSTTGEHPAAGQPRVPTTGPADTPPATTTTGGRP